MTLKGGFGYYNASNTLASAVTPASGMDYSLGYTTNITLPLGFAFEGEATYTTSTWLRRWLQSGSSPAERWSLL